MGRRSPWSWGAVALLLPLTTFACALGGDGGRDAGAAWVEAVVDPAPPRRDLLEMGLMAMVQAGYPGAEVDEARDAVDSEWRTNLQPFAREGTRRRATLVFEPRSEGGFHARARVELQVNQELEDPLNPYAARWEPAGEDPAAARVVLQHLLSLVATGGVPAAAGGRR